MTSQSLVWPNFFIVGAVKCGTTSLYKHLKSHPHVFLPDVKEPGYFAEVLKPVPKELVALHCPGDLVGYQRLFEGALDYSAIGDASPSYLVDEGASRRIYEASPKARIIVMLRDPVERAYSHYLLKVQEGVERRPFLEALQKEYSRKQKGWWTSQWYVEMGMYSAQVRRYLELFGREQVAVFLFDDLKRDPEGLFSHVARHIGVDPNLVEKIEVQKVHNPYKVPRSRTFFRLASLLSPRVRHALLPASVRWRLYNSKLLFNMEKPPQGDDSKLFLQAIYEPEVSKLEELLGRKMPELRKSWV